MNKGDVLKAHKLNTQVIQTLSAISRRVIGKFGDTVGLLNCEDGIIAITSCSKAILLTFQVLLLFDLFDFKLLWIFHCSYT